MSGTIDVGSRSAKPSGSSTWTFCVSLAVALILVSPAVHIGSKSGVFADGSSTEQTASVDSRTEFEDTLDDIIDPIEVRVALSASPALWRPIHGLMELSAMWTDLSDVRVSVDAPMGIRVTPSSWTPIDIHHLSTASFAFDLTPEAPGSYVVRVEASGISAVHGKVGGLEPLYLDVPMTGTGRVSVGNAFVSEGIGKAVLVTGPFATASPPKKSASPPRSDLKYVSSDGGGPKPNQDTYVVTGKWFYWKEDDVTLAAQRWASVEVRDENGSGYDVLWSGYTEANGSFISGPIERSQHPDMYVVFSTNNSAIHVQAVNGTIYSWSTGNISAGSLSIVDIGSRSSSTNKFAQRPFQYANDAYDYVANRAGFGSLIPNLKILIPDSCTYYTLNNDTIHLCGDGIDDKSPDDVIHEFGHYLQDKLYNDDYFPSPGGVHYLCEDNQNRGLAWTEGFADFFGPRVGTEIVNPADVYYTRPWDGSMFSINMEAANECPGVQGDDDEMQVSFSIWDLADSANDGSYDIGIGYSPTVIFDAINDCDQANYRNFYDGGLCNWVSRGNSRYDFIATAWQNRIDYNVPPSSQLTTQTTYQWVRGTITITATVSDIDTPVTQVVFRVSHDNVCQVSDILAGTDTTSPYSVTFDTTTTTEDSSVWTCAVASDVFETGGMATSLSSIGIDNTNPTATSSLSGTLGLNGWYVSAVSVSLSANDALSGVSSIRCRVDGGSWSTYSMPIDLTTDGTHTVEYYATDNAGNQQPTQSVQVQIDRVAPTTTASPAGTIGTNGWYLSNVAVTLSGSDATSGLLLIEYQIDGGSWTTYSFPFNIITDGTHTVAYRGRDNAGNLESTRYSTVKIDRVVPDALISVTGTQGLAGWYISSVVVSISASDATSGVATVQYRIDGGAWQPYSSSFTIATEGTHTVEYYALDNAGNQRPTRSEFMKIDLTAPSCSSTLTGTLGSNNWYVSDVSVSLYASDPFSGVSAIWYRLDGGSWLLYSVPLLLTDEGAHVVEYYARDNASNQQFPQSVNLRIDRIAPQTSAVLTGTMGLVGWYKSDVFVSLSSSDFVSGVMLIEYGIDGANLQQYVSGFSIGEGNHTLRMRAKDNAGNLETTTSTDIRVDKASPSSQASVAGTQGQNSWYVSLVVVTLSTSDSMSGVSILEYNLDSTGWTTYGLPLNIPDDGMHSVLYRASDVAGNVEATRSLTLSEDKDPPMVWTTFPAPDSWTRNRTLTVTWSAIDNASGIGHYEVAIDGGNFVSVIGEDIQLTDLTDGPHMVAVKAFDVAGNSSETSVRFQVDTVPPTVAIGTPSRDSVVSNDYVEVRWTRSDSGSGIKTCSLRTDERSAASVGLSQSYQVRNLADGWHQVTVTCDDVAGNRGEAVTRFQVSTSSGSFLDSYGFLLIVAITILVVLLLLAGALSRRRRKKKKQQVRRTARRSPPPPLPPPPPPEW